MSCPVRLPRQTIEAFSDRSVGHRLAIAEPIAGARAAAGWHIDRAKVRGGLFVRTRKRSAYEMVSGKVFLVPTR